jgi:signal peptidase I
LGIVLVSLLLAACGGEDGSFSFRVEGVGMSPTLEDGDVLTVEQYRQAPPERGDIVVFELPTNPGRASVKRIVALPGESLTIGADGSVAIDGEPLDEPYAFGETECLGTCVFTLPEAGSEDASQACGSAACYFVMGDNRMNSSDSRQGWLVRAEDIRGKVEP